LSSDEAVASTEDCGPYIPDGAFLLELSFFLLARLVTAATNLLDISSFIVNVTQKQLVLWMCHHRVLSYRTKIQEIPIPVRASIQTCKQEVTVLHDTTVTIFILRFW